MGTASKSLTLVLVALSLISLVTVPFAISADTDLSWTVQTVDDENAATYYCPIVIDSNNITHIAYNAIINGGYSVAYASWNGSGFSTQKVTSAGDGPYGLVLDTNNNPHILYGIPKYHGYPISRTFNPLTIAFWDGKKWNNQSTAIIDSNYASLAIDSLGNPDIAYIEGEAVKYASWTGTNWNIQTIDTSPQFTIDWSLYQLSFTLDSNNKPYILYRPTSYADYNLTVGIRAITVKLATFQNSNWNIQTVPLPPPTGDYGNLVVDSKDILHFVCTQHHFVSSENKTTLSTLLYVTWNGSAWNTQTVVSNIVLGSIGSLVLDSSDYPHISYILPAPEGLTEVKYASWTGTTWDIQTADSNDTANGTCFLALDANGYPHISFTTNTGYRYTDALKYITATKTTQTPSPTKNTDTSVIVDQMLPIALAVVVLAVIIVSLLLFRRHRKTQAT